MAVANDLMSFTAGASNISGLGSEGIHHGNYLNTMGQSEILGMTLHTTLVSIHALQGLAIILVNLVTITAICKFSFLREDCTCRFVASLACSDLLAGLAIVSVIITHNVEAPAFTHLCRLNVFLNYVSILGNHYNILFVTIEKFIYIVRPLRYVSIVTQFRTSVAIVALWCAAIIQVSVALVFHQTIRKPCNLVKLFRNSAYYYIMLVQSSVIIFIVIACNVKILWTAEQLRRTEPHISNIGEARRTQHMEELRRRRMAQTMAIISGVFLLCYVPVITFNMVIANLSPAQRRSYGIVLCMRILKIFLWMQSLVNPFIFAWRNKSFRRAFKELLPTKVNRVEPQQSAALS